MRIAYIGLTSPMYYDYKNSASKNKADKVSSPNPILDNPIGLMVLYDELWFLTRSLCPENLRNRPFVKFVDHIPKYQNLISNLNLLSFEDEIKLLEKYKIDSNTFHQIPFRPEEIGIYWKGGLDVHTHSLQIFDKGFSARHSLMNLMFDISCAGKLQEANPNLRIELITNSFTQSKIEQFRRENENVSNLSQSALTQLMILEGMHNYQAPKGPYHDCILEVREDKFLQDYRSWIIKQEDNLSRAELLEVKNEIENVIKEAQENIFLKYLDPKSHFVGTGKTLAGFAVDFLIPGLSTAYSLIEELNSFDEKRFIRWQGFVVSAKRKTRNKLK